MRCRQPQALPRTGPPPPNSICKVNFCMRARGSPDICCHGPPARHYERSTVGTIGAQLHAIANLLRDIAHAGPDKAVSDPGKRQSVCPCHSGWTASQSKLLSGRIRYSANRQCEFPMHVAVKHSAQKPRQIAGGINSGVNGRLSGAHYGCEGFRKRRRYL